jgi:hypothetical protein
MACGTHPVDLDLYDVRFVGVDDGAGCVTAEQDAALSDLRAVIAAVATSELDAA